MRDSLIGVCWGISYLLILIFIFLKSKSSLNFMSGIFSGFIVGLLTSFYYAEAYFRTGPGNGGQDIKSSQDRPERAVEILGVFLEKKVRTRFLATAGIMFFVYGLMLMRILLFFLPFMASVYVTKTSPGFGIAFSFTLFTIYFYWYLWSLYRSSRSGPNKSRNLE